VQLYKNSHRFAAELIWNECESLIKKLRVEVEVSKIDVSKIIYK